MGYRGQLEPRSCSPPCLHLLLLPQPALHTEQRKLRDLPLGVSSKRFSFLAASPNCSAVTQLAPHAPSVRGFIFLEPSILHIKPSDIALDSASVSSLPDGPRPQYTLYAAPPALLLVRFCCRRLPICSPSHDKKAFQVGPCPGL